MSSARREPDIASYRVRAEVPVRFRDTDAMGHVNNAVYLTYLEMARERYWRDVFHLTDYSKIDIILARAEVDFRSPAYVGETIVVGIRASAIGTRSFEFACEAWEKDTRRLVLEARTIQAMYDYAAKKTRPMSEAERRTILAFEAPGTVVQQ